MLESGVKRKSNPLNPFLPSDDQNLLLTLWWQKPSCNFAIPLLSDIGADEDGREQMAGTFPYDSINSLLNDSNLKLPIG